MARMIESLESRKYFTAFIVNTTADTVAADGFLSLREAIIAANTNTASADAKAGTAFGTDVILFAKNLQNATITLGGTQLDITERVMINAGSRRVVIDGGAASRVFGINTSGVVTMQGINITDGSAADGGGLLVDGGATVTLRRVSVHTNHATAGSGGGVSVNNGTLNLFRSDLTNNTATGGLGGGGAIVTASGVLNIADSYVNGNTATASSGGGIYNAGTIRLARVNMLDNVSDPNGSGGGIFSIAGSTAFMQRVLLEHNQANTGAGMVADGATVTMRRCRFEANAAGYDSASIGGGLLITNGAAVDAANTSFNNNAVTGTGGGIAMFSGTLTLTQSYMLSNTAGGVDGAAGGGLYVAGGTATLKHVFVLNNTVSQSTVTDTTRGGGIFNSGTLILDHSNVLSNSAVSGGGVFTDVGGVTTLIKNKILSNSPDDFAGTGTVQ
jgi:CSLREA domain-containing protein